LITEGYLEGTIIASKRLCRYSLRQKSPGSVTFR